MKEFKAISNVKKKARRPFLKKLMAAMTTYLFQTYKKSLLSG